MDEALVGEVVHTRGNLLGELKKPLLKLLLRWKRIPAHHNRSIAEVTCLK